MTRPTLILLSIGILIPAISFTGGPIQSAKGPGTATPPQETGSGNDQEEFKPEQIEFFETSVRPLLVEYCYDCHGPDADPAEGGLGLFSRKSILQGGDSGPGIDLDHAEKSNILSAVQYGDLFQMPPDSKLGNEEIEIIRKWVMDKAPWPAESDIEVDRKEELDLQKRRAEHWCWQPVSKATIPAVVNHDWILDPVDHFVLSKLEQAGLSPALPADRPMWLRRVTFDITGLPPTLAEIEAFCKDTSSNAFENVVDRLLSSPTYGERWARHWMDLIRYAETCGHEFDYPIPNAWQYRDYLIRAFNADVPYDEFVIEHIAGDLMDHPRLNPEHQTNESILGTGFWFLGEATHGPVDVKGDEAGRIDNQIDVMGKTFLGLTIACARCHDHKFDAISAEDYYGIAGFLQSSRRQDVMLDPDRKILDAWEDARAESRTAASAIKTFLSSMTNDDGKIVFNENYLKAAVLFLQQDDSWKLPNRLVIEGETAKQINKTGGKAGTQKINGWSNGSQIWWTEANVGDVLDLELNVPVAGNYEILARFTKARDYGIVQVLVNDKPAGQPIDLYSPDIVQSAEESLGKFVLDAGPQTIRLRITGKNEKAQPGLMVGVDYFVLRPDRDPVSESRQEARLKSMAEQFEINPVILHQWTSAIQDQATDDIEHPFYLLRKSAEATIDLESNEADSFYLELYREILDLEAADKKWMEELSVPFPDLDIVPVADWDRQGFAFLNDKEPGQLNPVDPDPVWSWRSTPPAHSGLKGQNFQGVLRSPTFTITHPKIHYYVAARSARIRLIIDGFRLDVNNALLFSGMNLTIDTNAKWKWIQQGGDLKNYIGHKAFIEIIDQGDGFIGLKEIRFSGKSQPGKRPSHISLNRNHHGLDAGRWHDARSNNGATPLELVTTAITRSLESSQFVSKGNDGVTDRILSNFLIRHQLIPDANYDLFNKTLADYRTRLQEINRQVPAPTLAIGMVDGSPEDEYVFIRGNHRNPGQLVSRSPITALKQPDLWNNSLKSSGRMELAENMVSMDHPLTRRVIVNRIWHHLFGQGIVPSVDNFGVLGNRPTHPELLDYLSNAFSDDGWSIKKMIRRLVLSQTYRMSSTSTVDAGTKDPNNDLLYKFRIRRLPGEAIRDSILAISEELDDTMHGPGVPIHLTSFMQGRGRPGNSGPLDGNGRRSIYIAVRRNFLSPMMLTFDTPIPFNSIGRRNNSNVPAQSLIMMNDPFVFDQAEKWAAKLILKDPDVLSRLQDAFVSSTGRAPNKNELRQLMTFYDELRKEQEMDEAGAWSSICHVLFNAKEFIFLK